jgi:hypothetical protein
MCAYTETDMGESANDYTLAGGEGHSSRGETFHPLYAARPVSSSAERTVCSVLMVGFVVLTKVDKRTSIFISNIPIFSSERMLNKDYDCKGSVE